MATDARRDQRGSEDRGKNSISLPHVGSILDSFVEAESLLRGKHENGETSLEKLKVK